MVRVNLPCHKSLLCCVVRKVEGTPRRCEVKGAPRLLDKANSRIEVNETTMCAITPLSKSMVL
jgi:hypothetical protein